MGGLRVGKAHAYGNDFLLVPRAAAEGDLSALTRVLCDRHRGLGADGVIFYQPLSGGASMTLFNADGSPSELSGNGVRCLAAYLAREQHIGPGAVVAVDTDAGTKTLELLAVEGERRLFRTAMGVPEEVRRVEIPVAGETLTATVLRMGNPQCIVLGALPAEPRFHELGPQLSTHAMFPAGTNVEFAQVEAPDRVRILIWERGVGPTTSSGTGSSASAVAAAVHGGAARDVEVIAPGGSQRVEWKDDGVYLTGWAAVVLDGEWTGGSDAHLP